jgi:hypothetical protein
MPSNRSKTFDGPEFIVSREFFNRYFEKPIPKSTFYDFVNGGRIIPWSLMRGRYLLNESLHRMGLPTVEDLPVEHPRRSLEDITRLAFTLIDPDLFPSPPWRLSVEVLPQIDLDHARRVADQHRYYVEDYSSPQEKLKYFGGVLDAVYLSMEDEKDLRSTR